MRIYVFLMMRGNWFSQCLAEDLQTSISGKPRFATFQTMIRALAYVGATPEAIHQLTEEQSLEQLGRGSLWLHLTPGRKNLLQVRKEWLR